MSRIIEMYRRVPDGWAFTLAAIISWVLAAIAGIAGAIAGVYLYDRGNSKGDDLAVLYIGLLAVGTFTFVVLFTWLQTLQHKISSRTPMFAWLFCLAGTLVVAVRLWPTYSLAKKFPFGAEVLELACYENKKRERVFRFELFLADWARRKQLPSLRALPLEAD